MQDIGIGMPSAVVVFSPNRDLTLSGDIVSMLKNADTVLNVIASKRLIAAYADIYTSTRKHLMLLQFMVTLAKDFHLR